MMDKKMSLGIFRVRDGIRNLRIATLTFLLLICLVTSNIVITTGPFNRSVDSKEPLGLDDAAPSVEFGGSRSGGTGTGPLNEPVGATIGNELILKNGDFESGTLGSVPDKWIHSNFLQRVGSHSNSLQLVNNRYYDGSKSVYFYTRLNSGSSDSGGAWNNLTSSYYMNAKIASKAIIYIQNIAVSHSYSWGWNSYIRVAFDDGTNHKFNTIFWNGEKGNFNNYVSSGMGADGNTWYKYMVDIPQGIDKSHMKIIICFIATSWTRTSGTNTILTGYVDGVTLDNNTHPGSLIEQNCHGGSWLDSFENDWGIQSNMSEKAVRYNGDVGFNYLSDKLPEKFETETPATKPIIWDNIDLVTGYGSHSNDLYVVNDRYEEGSQSVFFYSRFNTASSGGGISWNNLTLKEYISAPRSTNVTLFMSNITVSHSLSWGWNSYIRVVFDDGTTQMSDTIFWNGEGGSNNKYKSQGIGADGNTWNKYMVPIPSGIDKSNFKITVTFIATSWIFSNGRYTIISGNVDNISLDNYSSISHKLISTPIDLPENAYWDTFIFNRTLGTNATFNVSILDVKTNLEIYPSTNYTKDGEFNISYIDPLVYPSIRLSLNSSVVGNLTNDTKSPALHYWGVSWNFSYAWRDTFYGGLRGTSENLTAGDGEIWLNCSITNFTKYSGNPILKVGSSGAWDASSVTYPNIIYNNNEFLMYYTGVNSGGKWEIGLASSADGIKWTKYSGNPVLKVSSSGWDIGWIGRPSVVYDGTNYKMWYQGRSGSGNTKIGYATSSNGITWTKYPGNPVLVEGSPGSWESSHPNSPHVHFNGLEYKMWYTGVDSNSVCHIGYATSIDGINWQKFENNPVLPGPSSNPTIYTLGKSDITVYQKQNEYFGWYNNDTGPSAEIFYATSSNGTYWNEYANNPVIKKGPTNAWDTGAVHAPEFFMMNKQYWLFYSGRNNGGSSQIGLAKANFTNNGILTSDVIKLLPPDKHRVLVINKTEPDSTFINVSVLDGSTLQPIIGYENLRSKLVNITGISRAIHPTIILEATFQSNGSETPVLYDWSVGPYRGARIVNVKSNNAVYRTKSVKIAINTSQCFQAEADMNLEVKYKSPSDLTWQTNYLSSPKFAGDRWECVFTPEKTAELGSYTFNFTCWDFLNNSAYYSQPHTIMVLNNRPAFNFVTPGSTNVNRTHTVNVLFNATDIETPSDNLTFTVKYKSQFEIFFETKYLSAIEYSGINWLINFTPPENATLGLYLINFSCNDSLVDTYYNIVVNVVNNAPRMWWVNTNLTENYLNRTKSIKMTVNSTDKETPTDYMNVVVRYMAPSDVTWQTSYLSPINYLTGHWEINFTPPASAEIGWYTINIYSEDNDSGISHYNLSLLVKNNKPIIWDISLSPNNQFVYRTKKIQLIINATDLETLPDDLTLSIYYKSPNFTGWQGSYLEDKKYEDGFWKINFTPPWPADLGLYTFNINCSDNDLGFASEELKITVLNNKPTIWTINTNTTATQLFRTQWLKLLINATDIDMDHLNDTLITEVRYKSPKDVTWQTTYLSNLNYNSTTQHWVVDFNPKKTADVGWYTFNVTCSDPDGGVAYKEMQILVKNNVLEILDVNVADNKVNRTRTVEVTVDVFDLEIGEENLQVDLKYKSPLDTSWHTEYIKSIIYQDGNWVIKFSPPRDADLGLYQFQVTCNDTNCDITSSIFFVRVYNNIPIIEEVTQSGSSIKRTETVKIYIDSSDIEITEDELDVFVVFKSPNDPFWQSSFISNLYYSDNLWVADFTPGTDAVLGLYTLRIVCNDTDTEVYDEIEVKVRNNIPTAPGVTVLPVNPNTKNELTVDLVDALDVETFELDYWYRWYRNGYYLKQFDNITKITSTETTKGETWRCFVYAYDGIDLSPPGDGFVDIVNSPPELVMEYSVLQMVEDTPLILDRLLTTIFNDVDEDELSFTANGQNKINIKIFHENGTIELKPAKNWYGTETVTFYASDGSANPAEETVLITVLPANDLPTIDKVGNQMTKLGYPELEYIVRQDDWLNLFIEIDDIDGDVERGMIHYQFNMTWRDNFYFNPGENEIKFKPTNADVGWHYLNIEITDGNETPIVYISQHIKIRVLNVNDPPTVSISQPLHGSEFLKGEGINFSCKAEDIDLLIPNTQEKLTYTWYSNRSGQVPIGTTSELTNISLEPGYHNIMLEVEDSSGETDKDFIHLVIKEPKQPGKKDEETPKEKETTTDTMLWAILLLIIIIIVMAVLFAFLYFRKKRGGQAPTPQPQQPQEPSTSTMSMPPEYTPPQPRGPPVAPGYDRTHQPPPSQQSPSPQPPGQVPPTSPVQGPNQGQVQGLGTEAEPTKDPNNTTLPRQLPKDD
jgi:predicted GH43/DUF377 family glycosyl hydrolase